MKTRTHSKKKNLSFSGQGTLSSKWCQSNTLVLPETEPRTLTHAGQLLLIHTHQLLDKLLRKYRHIFITLLKENELKRTKQSMPLQADQGNFQSRGHVREIERSDLLTTLSWAELWVSGSVFILKIPTINYKKFKELKTSQERDTRNSGDDSIFSQLTNTWKELQKLI